MNSFFREKICKPLYFDADPMLFELTSPVTSFLSKYLLAEIVFECIFLYICNHFRRDGRQRKPALARAANAESFHHWGRDECLFF